MSEVKKLRKEVRRAVEELLPEILANVILRELVLSEIKKIEEATKATMHEMNERHKNTMGYLVRQVSKPTDSN